MNNAVSGAEKDVEQQLLSGRRRARNSGVPYPLHHNTAILNFDNWNHMFLKKCCRSLTMYQFISPPSVILDLGCGGGYWAIEAAKQWPGSTVVGFDLNVIQPDLHKIEMYKDLAGRVKWVHGNLLDGLPFSSDQFDFVRIVNIGLGVPEDEWQTVFEEVSRVMKPGAVLEIIEEDLIFPCANFARNRPRPPPITVDFPRSDSLPSSNMSIRTSATLPSLDLWPSSFEETFESMKSLLSPSFLESPPTPTHWPTNTSTLVLPESEEDEGNEIHPQDHSRLKASWDRMLSSRFLNSSVINVLPFYLSTCFVDVQSHPPMQVSLPSNSSTPTSAARTSSELDSSYWSDADSQFSLVPYSGRKSNDVDKGTRSRKHSPISRDAGHSMHLARAVSNVVACKEAIWNEYKTLYGPELPRVTRTARPKEAASQAYTSSAREGFDKAWSNWEHDMEDRIGFRHCVGTELCWTEPPGDRPDWRIWKDNVDMIAHKTDRVLTKSKPGPLCRSLRGFVAWKPR